MPSPEDAARTIKVPKSHPPVLPHGPEKECKDEDAIDARIDRDLGDDYAGCIRLIEDELNDVAGLGDSDAIHFQGRAQGPEFVWKQVGNNTAAFARTTSASRAWRRSASWLNQVGVATDGKGKLAAC